MMRDTHKKMADNLAKAQAYQKTHYDKHHTPMTFKQGDMVMLNTKNLRIRKHPSPDGKLRPKLAPRYIGPFRVREVKGSAAQAYQLWLPPAYTIHDTFHISLLKPYNLREGGEAPAEAEEVLDNGEEIWQVERILKDRTKDGQKEYLLRWQGYSPEWDSWENEKSFEDMSELLDEYWAAKKGKKKARRAI